MRKHCFHTPDITKAVADLKSEMKIKKVIIILFISLIYIKLDNLSLLYQIVLLILGILLQIMLNLNNYRTFKQNAIFQMLDFLP